RGSPRAARSLRASSRAAAGDRACLLWRLQPHSDRRDARDAGRHSQGPDAPRLGEAAPRIDRATGDGGMTANDHTTGRGGCGADAGAYVLGALEGEEAQAFRRHLAICVVCRDEVAALQTAVNALPMAVPQLPTPRTLRRRVMSSIRAEPKTT